MLGAAAAAFLLCLLPKATAQLLKTDAQCNSGFEWMFSSIGQSPCDVAAELAAVCVGGQFNLSPLDEGYVYLGPSLVNSNSCRCSSVYYSLLSSCAFCQGRNYLRWSGYNTNCSTVYVTVYNQQIPAGVKVPAYAYQNVSVSDNFNVTLAQTIKGTESSRPPTSGTSIPTYSSAILPSPGNSSSSKPNIPAIVGGVVGGFVGLAIIGGLITFCVFRSKQKPKSQAYASDFQHSPTMAITQNTTASLIPITTSPPPGSPSRVYDPNDPATYPAPYPSSDPSTAHGSYNMYASPADPYRQQSPFNPNVTPNYTGQSAQSYGPTQTMPGPQHTGRPHFTGAPEL